MINKISDKDKKDWEDFLSNTENLPNKDINLNVSKPEFVSFCWIKPEKFNLMWVPDFKRKVYTEVFRDFYDLDIT